MIECTRKLQFCAGHRVMGHEGKCSHLHGHNYAVEITARANKELDSIGRVVDFGILKHVYDPWIQEKWDHGFLLNKDDKYALTVIAGRIPELEVPQKLYLLPYNPTAENIAKFLGTEHIFLDAINCYEISIVKVVVHETPNCFATWTA